MKKKQIYIYVDDEIFSIIKKRIEEIEKKIGVKVSISQILVSILKEALTK